MSLFENDLYQWRETYFVLFEESTRPQAKAVVDSLREQDSHYEVSNVVANDAGQLESLTLRSPEDSSAMDITYVNGDEVTEQREELLNTLAKSTLAEGDRDKLNFLGECDSRFDIYHFEEASFIGGDEGEDDPLDPGALLLVMDCLARLCQGVGIDPQSGSLM
ncbi:MAG: hypothetical protein H6822_34075 [Planctomycetaceae bacterium]|nr:hypothetical protein [Planctomycetales bacterium]MCB9927214.1 hypothetical protein [Planctomycetaceae bacterium]